jgi:glutathione S-transferase
MSKAARRRRRAVIQLYSTFYCPYALRTRIVLKEKALPHEHTEIDLKNKPPDFLKISPYGKVPVLIDGEARIYESAIINEYLDETYPEPALMPADPQGRAYVRIWVDFANNHLMRTGWRAVMGPEEKRAEALEEYLELLKTLEKEIDGKQWLAGDPFTLGDIAYAPIFARMDKQEHLDWGMFPNLKRWWDRIAGRPAYRATGGLDGNG